MTRLEESNAARNELLALAEKISIPALVEACKVVIHNQKFAYSIGGTTHHDYEGGLAIHTLEVTSYAVKMAGMFFNKNMAGYQSVLDVVTTAGIFHDFMKIRDYANGTKKTPYRFLVRHLAGSHAEFMKAIDGKKVPDEIVMRIEHAMLAHHGKYEYGSPIEPQLLEAYILHYADNFSKHFGEGRQYAL